LSLSVEEQFYLLWPPLLVMARRRTAVTVAVALIVLFPLMRAIHHVAHINSFAGPMFFDNLMVGRLAAIIAQRAPETITRYLSWHPPALRAAAVPGMIALNELQDHFLLGILTVPFAYTIQALCAAYLIASYVFNRTGIGYMLLNVRPRIGSLDRHQFLPWRSLLGAPARRDICDFICFALLCFAGEAVRPAHRSLLRRLPLRLVGSAAAFIL
jgi:peptidoglycan/LPS O-acetylase OafA/YrhL